MGPLLQGPLRIGLLGVWAEHGADLEFGNLDPVPICMMGITCLLCAPQRDARED